MILENKNLKDFALEYYHILEMYPAITKKSATQRLFRLKKKLKKPNNGVLLGSEYCELVGINMMQLYRVLFP